MNIHQFVGGEGHRGRVIKADNLWTTVKWQSGHKSIYRLGKMRLKCVEAVPGGFIYRDHLPVLGEELLQTLFAKEHVTITLNDIRSFTFTCYISQFL